ncbi:hypothetical protein [Terrabacter terrigena]|uniref:Uncharacterized protein n=1 Tax=Terrabacter terrigena TaxID=574718 RepID=A0ABW3N0A3_9MICO
MTPTPADQERLATDLIALARNATANVDRSDQVDYWYRLCQRNAYAHATGMLLSNHVADDPFRIAERITSALEANVRTTAELRSAAYGLSPDNLTARTLHWIGPREFNARFGHTAGIDHDYGFLWGSRRDERISLRISSGQDEGLLYVYDRTWDEYAVLSESANRSAVEAAYARAVRGDLHLDPCLFASLVAAAAPAAGLTNGAPTAEAPGVEL